MAEIRKAAVLGADVMGGGIAAHRRQCRRATWCCSTIVPPRAPAAPSWRGPVRDRRRCPRELKKRSPPRHPRAHRRLITIGDFDDDLPLLADATGSSRPSSKGSRSSAALPTQLDGCGRRGRSSPRTPRPSRSRRWTEGPARELQHHFLITHFFNPPRSMRLLEFVAGPSAPPPRALEPVGLRRPPASARASSAAERHAQLHRQPHRQLLDRACGPRGD